MIDIQQWRRDGFAVIDTGASPHLLDAVAEFSSSVTNGRVQDAWKSSPCVRDLALCPTVLGALRMLHDGRRPIPFQTLNFRVGTQQAAHSDTIHFDTEPSGWMAGAWVALEDIHPDAGPLVYYPGSHLLPTHRLNSFGLPPGRGSYSAYEIAISGIIATHNLTPQYGTIRRGQCILWAANLLHGGSPIVNPSLTRKSQVTHYFFDEPGVRFVTPLLGTSRTIREIQ